MAFGGLNGPWGRDNICQDLPGCLEVQAVTCGPGPILPLDKWDDRVGSVSGTWATDFPFALPVWKQAHSSL